MWNLKHSYASTENKIRGKKPERKLGPTVIGWKRVDISVIGLKSVDLFSVILFTKH